MKKYELIKSDKVSPRGIPLFQVVALRDFGSVMEGDKGGYIESEANLSHEGTAWVGGDAQVSGTAWVGGTAWIFGTAQVSGTALVYGNARIFRDTQITAGHAFATKDNSWDITEVNNGNGTSTLYADAVFEPVEPACDHVTGGVPDEEGKAMVFCYCPKCGNKL